MLIWIGFILGFFAALIFVRLFYGRKIQFDNIEHAKNYLNKKGFQVNLIEKLR